MNTYGSDVARDITLAKLRTMLKDHGVKRLFVKHLAPNDNSKNQPYFGGDFSSLNVIPTGDIEVYKSVSEKKKKEETIFRAPVKLSWLTPNGELYPAPNAKLILYPQYPEVRFSGFLQGSKVKMGPWMNPEKEGRAEGRTLVLGITDDEIVVGYFIPPDFPLAIEISNAEVIKHESVFNELSLSDSIIKDTKQELLEKLLQIHNKGWIPSKRLNSAGIELPCSSSNCGGYTLEAELGITPNGYAEPDYLGWEVKQFGVQSFEKVMSKIITLMTPEPSGGVYVEKGVGGFLRQFGYEDKLGRPDRINFGGVHKCNIKHKTTNLLLSLDGFNAITGKIIEPSGGIILTSESGVIAAKWDFSKLLDHWKTKHNQAVYIPSLSKKLPIQEYFYGQQVMLGEGTDFSMLLKALATNKIYYDPGIKMEKASSSSPKIKRRSQFRIKSCDLSTLYQKFTYSSLL